MIKIFEFNDCKIVLNDTLIIHQMYIGNGLNYEVHVRKELEKYAPQSKVMWDLGSNAGLHTVSAKQINSELQVLCVEPALNNYTCLLKTIALNGWKDVFVLPVTIGRYNGLLGINDDPTNPTCGPHGQHYQNWVPHFTLDALDLPLPQLVKIDIEGCEFAAWQGATKLIAARPVVISEFNLPLLQPKGEAEAYIDFFIDRGYNVTILDYLPGMRKQVYSGTEAVAHVMCTSGAIADFIAEPI